MRDSTGPWTIERLSCLDEAQFQILWFATFGGPPAAILDRQEMERIFLEYAGEIRRPGDRLTARRQGSGSLRGEALAHPDAPLVARTFSTSSGNGRWRAEASAQGAVIQVSASSGVEDHRHGLRVDRADHGVRLGREEP